jgi:hypothetical protein
VSLTGTCLSRAPAAAAVGSESSADRGSDAGSRRSGRVGGAGSESDCQRANSRPGHHRRLGRGVLMAEVCVQL